MQQTGIGIIILAAGSSSRLGQAKQLVQFRGQTLIERIIETGLTINEEHLVVVLGANAEKIEPLVKKYSVNICHNENWKTGMGSSIAKGMEVLKPSFGKLNAVLILLCDQPFVDTFLLQKIIDTFHTNKKLIIASHYKTTFGVPALFAPSLFPELLKLNGQKGAKKLMLNYKNQLVTVPFPKGHIDVDTQEDLVKLQNL